MPEDYIELGEKLHRS